MDKPCRWRGETHGSRCPLVKAIEHQGQPYPLQQNLKLYV